MTLEEIQTAIDNTVNGANITVQAERPVKLRKAYQGMPVTVEKTFPARIGVNYDHIEEVKEARKSGELPAENQGLKGMEWKQFPFLLKSTKNDKLYVRMYGSTFRNGTYKTVYKVDGEEVAKEGIEHMMLASETKSRKRNPGQPFNISVHSIKQLNRDYAADWEEVEATKPVEAV